MYLLYFFWVGDGEYLSIVPPPAFTGDAISLFVGDAPFAPFAMTFVAIVWCLVIIISYENG